MSQGGKGVKGTSVSSKGKKGYHKILAWQRAHELTLAVYRLLAGFPRHELYGLTKQLRDAAVSVPANIVEGYGRNTTRQYLYHLNVSWGSLAEVEYFLELARDLPYITQEQYDEIEALRRETAYLLYRLILSITKKVEQDEKAQHVLKEQSEAYLAGDLPALAVFDPLYPPLPSAPTPSAPSGSLGPSVSSTKEDV